MPVKGNSAMFVPVGAYPGFSVVMANKVSETLPNHPYASAPEATHVTVSPSHASSVSRFMTGNSRAYTVWVEGNDTQP